MTPPGTLATVIVVALSLTGTAGEADQWADAEKAIVRVQESAFPHLPERVRRVARELGCSIPQPGDSAGALPRTPVNVVSGQFARAAQVDWALLCSSAGRSEIHVVWGGPATCPTPLAGAADRDYLQGRGESGIHFSRQVIAAGPSRILATYRSRGDAPPRVSHDAIEDLFVDKASVRHYCDSGAWKTLLGAD